MECIVTLMPFFGKCFKLCFCVLLCIFIVLFANGQIYYAWNRNDTEAEKFYNVSLNNDVIKAYISTIDNILMKDTSSRKARLVDKNIRLGITIDSLNALQMMSFFSKYGIPTLNKLNIENDGYRNAIESKRNLIFLHLIVENYDKFFYHMERSVKNRIANMSSYCDLAAQYLYRITEFDDDQNFKYIPLPKFGDTMFQIFFLKSIIDFLNWYYKNTPISKQQFLLCKNPFCKTSKNLFISETIEINKKFISAGIKYKSTPEFLIMNLINNFNKYQNHMKKFNVDYMFILYIATERDNYVDLKFK